MERGKNAEFKMRFIEMPKYNYMDCEFFYGYYPMEKSTGLRLFVIEGNNKNYLFHLIIDFSAIYVYKSQIMDLL